LKLADAKQMIEAAKVKAAEIGKPVSIVVLDAAGCMVAMERADGAGPHTSFMAEGKAAASALTGRNSGTLANMTQNTMVINALSNRTGQRLVPMQGAIVLSDGGGVAGAIGVSGATSEEDEQIAEAGAAVFKK
jgi:uncharacterized protein GlcG (DUF336 family)